MFLLAGVLMVIVVGCSDDDESPTEPEALSVQEKLETSLHNTTRGMEYFYSSAQGGFEALTGVPYDDLSCKNCHVDPAGCMDCHENCNGTGTPDDSDCGVCHGRQNAEQARGLTDYHRDVGNLKCADCHGADDVHGDGMMYSSMLEPGAIKSQCSDCHDADTLPENAFHNNHKDTFECSACHMQSVVSCLNCHFDSEVDNNQKIALSQVINWKFLIKRMPSGKIDAANVMTLIYRDTLAHVVFAPYYGHTIDKNATMTCGDCHASSALQEYNTSGEINVVTWDGSKLVQGHTGTIPIPPDWETSMKFDYATIESFNPMPPHVMRQVMPTQVGKQMLFGEPLSQMPPEF
jgi:hypothetical protein